MPTELKEQAVEAAKEHTKLCCDCMEGKAVDYRPCIMARYILQPAPPAEAWMRDFVRKCLAEGYHSATVVVAADKIDKLAAELSALIAAQGRAGDDGEPVTEEWLLSIGFTTMDAKRYGLTKGIVNICPPLETLEWWAGIGTNNTYSPIPMPKNRGAVRRLLAALGIPN